MNDYHHAKDAYLNIVVGDVYNTKFTDNPWNWMKKNRNAVDSGQISFYKTMCFDVKDSNGNVIWQGCNKIKSEDGKHHFDVKEDPCIPGNSIVVGGDIERIRNIVRKNTCMYTEYTYCSNGVLFDASQQRKGSASATLRLKDNLPVERYGGYKSAKSSYFAMVEFDGKKGERIKNIIGVPIYISNMLEHNPNAFVEYCVANGMRNVSVICPKIKKNSLMIVDCFPMRIRGENEKQIIFKSNLQLKIDNQLEEIIRKIEKVIEKGTDVVDELHDRLLDKDLVSLYDVFIEKMENGLYKKRPANQCNTLKLNRKTFVDLELKEKCIVLNEILTMLRCDGSTCANLKLIDGTPYAGSITVNKNTACKNTITIINQSVTGLLESREYY